MVIFLYGQDTYRSRQKLNEIIEHYRKTHKSGLSLKYFDGAKLNFRDFRKEIQTASMFGEKKLAILENIFLNSEFRAEFLKNIKTSNKSWQEEGSGDVILFYEQGDLLKEDSLFEFLKKQAKSQKFEFLGGQKLKNWIQKEFKNYKTEINSPALEKLINFVGNNLWQLSNEIKKLVSHGSRKKVGISDVELLVRPKIETDIFKTINALALKDKKRAIELIHKHLEKGDHPLYLLSMINFQFRNLLIIKDLIEKNMPYYAILKASKLHPFIVKKSWYQANKFTLFELKKIYQKIFQADLDIKTGKISAQIALDLLVAEI